MGVGRLATCERRKTNRETYKTESLKNKDSDFCMLSSVKAFRKDAYLQKEGMNKGTRVS